ncbi:MAG TPA: hypothetical protein VGN01_06195 [Acidobacteriaceae bacterium]|jgi:hypothetical protein
MKRLSLLLLLFSVSLAAQSAPAADPLAPIAWMAGGTWHGEVNGPSGKLTKIDTRVEPEFGGKAFNFTTRFDGVLQYHGFFAYDAAKKAVIFSYPSGDGGLASGSVTQAGDSQVWDFTMTEATGSVGHFQVHTHQTGADDYTWALFASQGDSWTKLLEVHYHRTKD